MHRNEIWRYSKKNILVTRKRLQYVMVFSASVYILYLMQKSITKDDEILENHPIFYYMWSRYITLGVIERYELNYLSTLPWDGES